MKSEQFNLHAEIEARHWWFVGRRKIILDLVRTIVPPSNETLIVDVGCGTGGNISELSADYRCIGIDTSEEAIRIAKSRFPEVTFIHGRAPKDLGSAAQSGDLFLLLDVLEHIEFDKDFFVALFNALKRGAYILVTVPAKKSLWSPHDINYGHFRRYEPHELKSLWEDLPATLCVYSYFNTFLYPLIKAVRILNRIRNQEWGEAGTDLSLPPKAVNYALAYFFSLESHFIKKLAKAGHCRGFPFGVSLLALIRKNTN